MNRMIVRARQQARDNPIRLVPEDRTVHAGGLISFAALALFVSLVLLVAVLVGGR